MHFLPANINPRLNYTKMHKIQNVYTVFGTGIKFIKSVSENEAKKATKEIRIRCSMFDYEYYSLDFFFVSFPIN